MSLLLSFFLLAVLGCNDDNSENQAVTSDQAAATSGETEVEMEVHEEYFAKNAYDGTATCLECHQDEGNDVLTTGHWKWQGVAANIEGYEDKVHGKNDLLNNFCIAVPSNEGRCTQCHIGYDYADKNYDFNSAENIDCLVCHDQTGTYKKAPTTAGLPDPAVDLLAVATSVGKNEGLPQRANCIGCHANAGGGDNVKHGDLSTAMLNTTREFDVHMGTDGGNFSCVACHDVERNAAGEQTGHGIGGMPFHSVEEGTMKQCTDCHGTAVAVHADKNLGNMFTTSGGSPRHERLACQVCHIPKIAQQIATKVEWDWSTAGQDIDPIPVDPISGRATYDKKKGTFVWGMDVKPVLRVHNGKWKKLMINVNDRYVTTPVQMSEPAADPTDATAKIYPFKLLEGKQVADAGNKTMLVPHLFGTANGPNPYWGTFDWDAALQDGATYTGQTYSGAFEFVDTEMLLTVNHEVAPAELALGQGGDCTVCHGAGSTIDWTALGHTSDPKR
ncbi:MAG: tetrathionate reductase family octaheme c-type cytochrome [Pontibacterium sp.]